jgi:hypothetical protein
VQITVFFAISPKKNPQNFPQGRAFKSRGFSMRQMVARDIGVGNKNPEPAIVQESLNATVKPSSKIVT